MADISITTYTNKRYKEGASTTVPGFIEGSPGSPVNPPGSGGASEFVPSSRSLTINGTAYDLSADRTWSVGTVTSVSALTIGTTGTDITSTVANGTTTPVITLNIPTASASNRGALSSTDWNTFNGKIGGTIASGQVAFGTGVNTIGGDGGLTWDNTNKVLGLKNQPSQLVLGSTRGSLQINEASSNALILLQRLGDNSFQPRIIIGKSRGTSVSSPSQLQVNDIIGELAFYGVGTLNSLTLSSSISAIASSIGTSVSSNIYYNANFHGFNTTSPTNTLDVNGTGRIRNGVSLADVSGNVLVGTLTDAGQKLQVNGAGYISGDLLIGTTTVVSGHKVRVSGGALNVTNWTSSSGAYDKLSIDFGETRGIGYDPFLNEIFVLGATTTPVKIDTDASTDTLVVSSSSNVLVGTSTDAGQKLQVAGNILVNTNGQGRLISTYYPTGSLGNNIFIGGGGQSSSYTFFETGSYNTSLGVGALNANTTGFDNTANGFESLYSNTTGIENTASGYKALYSNTTGGQNTANGVAALYSNTTGYENTAKGVAALYSNTTGRSNTASGYQALSYNTTGDYNTAYGYQAGRFTNSTGANETSTNSVYIGYDTRSSADGNTNEIVIGANGRGKGSNKIVIGISSITDNYIAGNFNITDAKNFIIGTSTGTKFGTATSQKIGFWNATPIVQPTTGIAESAFVENSGGVNVNDDSTFDGYTLRQVVKALRDAGLLA